jgi:hypothetical protein
MRILRIILVFVVLAALVPAAGAQIIRGTVEDSTGMPLNDVRISILAAGSDSVIKEARTGNAGDFNVNVGRTGRYRVRLNRLGFAQHTSEPMELRQLQIVTVRFTLLANVQILTPVVVVERRNISRDELMSAAGFDLRQNRYPMQTLDAEQLAVEGAVDIESMIFMGRFPGLEIVSDTLGTSIRMRGPPVRTTLLDSISDPGAVQSVPSFQRGYCFPELYLDGTELSGGDGRGAERALLVLGSITTDMLYGLEVYRGTQIPPPGLGGMFGSNSDSPISTKPCGVVALWTNEGREHAVTAERARAQGSVQVVRGKVADFATGKAVAGALVLLRSEYGVDLEPPVTSDSNGVFRIPTKHFERMRLVASAGGYAQVVTPAFAVDLEELLTVEVILAPTHVPLAPLMLVSRELARMYSATDARGFGYRSRKGTSGTFFDDRAVASSGAASLAELIGGIPNVVSGVSSESAPIVFRMAPPPVVPARGRNTPQTPSTQGEPVVASAPAPTCRPMYFLNGELQREPEKSVLNRPLSDFQGVEVYPLAAELPYSYRIGSTGCGAIVVWTKRELI